MNHQQRDSRSWEQVDFERWAKWSTQIQSNSILIPPFEYKEEQEEWAATKQRSNTNGMDGNDCNFETGQLEEMDLFFFSFPLTGVWDYSFLCISNLDSKKKILWNETKWNETKAE